MMEKITGLIEKINIITINSNPITPSNKSKLFKLFANT